MHGVLLALRAFIDVFVNTIITPSARDPFIYSVIISDILVCRLQAKPAVNYFLIKY
jgi:hypothetical protein